MKRTVPRTPFATPLSGSARETELRLRNIFQWKKQRPPVWLMALVAVVILGCCGLVSCQPTVLSPQVVLDLQYYDELGNRVEVPALAAPTGRELTPTQEAINGELAQLGQTYRDRIQALDPAKAQEVFRLLCHPSSAGRYLSLVLYEDTAPSANEFALSTWVYDQEEDRRITLEEALSMAEVDLDRLQDQLGGVVLNDPQNDWTLLSMAPEGFRIDEAGQVTFYLRATLIGPLVQEFDVLYLYTQGDFTPFHLIDEDPLVPLEELDVLTPALWAQWHLGGGPPEGGLTRLPMDGLSELESDLLRLLAGDRSGTEARALLASVEQDGKTLGAASFTGEARTDLVIGVMDNASRTLVGSTFQCEQTSGTARAVAFQQDGEAYLLYTNIGTLYDSSMGEAGLVMLGGEDFSWTWPVEGDIRTLLVNPRLTYDAYWRDHLAILCPGGVELFTANPDYHPTDDPVQWQFDSIQRFYDDPEGPSDALITAARNVWADTASFTDWRILSLTRSQNPTLSTSEAFRAFDLTAERAFGPYQTLTGTLVLNEDNEVAHLAGWNEPEPDYADPWEELDSPANLALRDQLILDYLNQDPAYLTHYFAGTEPEPPIEDNTVRIENVVLLGETQTYETTGVAYLVTRSIYQNHRETADAPGVLGWYELYPLVIVLGRSAYDGWLENVRGTDDFHLGKDTTDLIREVSWNLMDAQVSLTRAGYPIPVGPGGQIWCFREVYDGPEEIEILEGWDLYGWPGAYWAWHRWEGFAARCYHVSEGEGYDPSIEYRIDHIETTRTDLYTPRGIHAGSTRAEVLEAYPTALTGNYWDQYPEEKDMLIFLPLSNHDPAEVTDMAQIEFYAGLGPAMLFQFDGDTVRQIVLTNMHN